MTAISVAVDKRAALLAGRDLGDRVTVEVTPETIGAALWPVLVASLDLSTTPPYARNLQVAEATAEAVGTALAARVADERRPVERYLAEIRDALAKIRQQCAAAPVPRKLRANAPGCAFDATYDGFARDITKFYTYSPSYSLRADDRAEIKAMLDEMAALKAASDAELAALNATALAAAMPALIEAYATAQAALKAKAAEEDAAKQAAIAERAALRLVTGYWERETAGYNDRRYAAPWCARVTGVTNGKLDYAFGDSTARHGSSGLLRVACKPGDIIAWGQRDLRKPANSEHQILRMRDDGRMIEIDRTEAYKLLTAKAGTPAP